MVEDSERCAQKVRSLVLKARADNSRMVAAAIGGHLSGLQDEVEWSNDVGAMTDLVRDRCVRLLTDLKLGRSVKKSRRAAIKAVERLEGTLVAPDDPLRSVRPALNRRVLDDVLAGAA